MNFNRLFSKLFGLVVLFLPGLAMVCFVLFVEIPRAIDEYTLTTDIGEFLALVAFGAVFIFLGYLQISDSAGAKAKLKYVEWNRGFRLGFYAFLVVGLGALAMSVFESAIYLFFALPFSLIGGFGLYNFYSKEKTKRELPRSGRKIECTNIIVEQDSISSGYLLGTDERLSPYLIKCSANEPSTNLPFVFVSEPIWFDPKPYLKDTITVFVNPEKYTEYLIDTSFLPKETRKIIHHNYTFKIG